MNSGTIGGNVSTAERERMVRKYLTPIADKAVDFGWKRQCRCGDTRYVQWRKRWYCVRCGRWVREFVR